MPSSPRVQAFALFATLVISCNAAPAFIWKTQSDESSVPKYSSVPVHASTIISSAASKSDTALDVFFLVGRKGAVTEGLSHLASTGALPLIASKYDRVDTVYHNVDYLSSPALIVSLFEEALNTKNEGDVLDVDIIEYNRLLDGIPIAPLPENPSDTQKRRYKRTQAIEKARVLVLKIAHSDNVVLDSAVAKAIESDKVNNVVLAGLRSTDEVRMEREMRQTRTVQRKSNNGEQGRRRLEDAQDDDANNNNEDLSGVYYVNMTPNIFAGILFTLMFAGVISVGLNCLNAIEGQNDYYVDKYPTIGREA